MAQRSPVISILPRSADYLDEAVRAGGGRLGDIGEASGLVWTDTAAPTELEELLAANPNIDWVQLPWAGVDPYLPLIRSQTHRAWTSAKWVYGPPVGEMALALLLALFRGIDDYARTTAWTKTGGRRLHGSRVTVVGGGGIARSFVDYLAPFDCDVTIVRGTNTPFDGADRTVTADRLHEVLPDTDALVLALPLTDGTRGLIGSEEFALLPDDAVLVNVARGPHVDTDALLEALRDGTIGGAALDVTDPEPLPDDHPLWHAPNVLITPHTANTKRMSVPLLGGLVTENVGRWLAGEELTSVIDPGRGY